MHSLLVAALVLATAAAPAAAQDLTGPNGTSDAKVLVLGLDGTRIDLLQGLMEAGRAPNLKALTQDGYTVASLLDYQPPEALTLSEVGWSSIATGVWPAKHGVNGYRLNMDPKQATKNGYRDFLSAIEAEQPRLSTFLASDWANIGRHENGGPIFGDAVDARFAIAAEDSIESYDAGDEAVTAASERYLATGNPDAGFVYFGVIDETAHLAGSATPAYSEAIERTDARIGRLVAAIRRRETYLRERWLILATTDHGQREFEHPSLVSHGGGSDIERTSFVTVSGFGAPGNPERLPEIVDIAPTVLTYLGLAPATDLDGVALAPKVKAPAPTLRARRKGRRLTITVRAPQGSPDLKKIAARGETTRSRAGARKLTLTIRARRARVRVTDVDGRRTTRRV